jgi:pilus assembly protein CpaE
MDLRTVGVLMGSPELIAALRECVNKLPVRITMEARDIVSAAAQLRQACPQVLFLEAPFSESLFSELRELTSKLPAPPVLIAAGGEPTPDLLMEIMQLGVRGYIAAPFDPARVWQTLDRLAFHGAESQTQHSAKILGFLSVNGGAGATTLACHVAARLQSVTESDVALADFDLDSGMVGFWMNLESDRSTLDAMNHADMLDMSLWGGLVTKLHPGLDVLIAPSEPPTKPPSPEDALHVLRFARAYYDWMVIDLGHGRGPLTPALASAADTLFVVSSADVPDLFQTRRMLKWLRETENSHARVKLVAGRVRKEQNYFRKDEVENMMGAPVAAVLPDDVAEVHAAHAARRLVSPGSGLGKAVTALVGSIAGGASAEEKPKSRFSLFRSGRSGE